MTKVRILNSTLFIVFLFCIACGRKAQTEQNSSSETATPTPFTLPTPPAVITDPLEQNAYVALHYWSNYQFSDTTLLANNNITEQAFADFIYLLSHLPETHYKPAIDSLLTAASQHKEAYSRFTGLAEHYLFDPNSPLRNETLFICFLEHIVANPNIDNLFKVRPEHQLQMALKNRPGSVAANFSITLASGKRMELHRIKSDFTVLYFNNPDCTDCKRVTEYMQHGTSFNNKNISIVSVYVDDEMEIWHQHNYPSTWINGYNSGLREKNLYDLRAIPTLYLLDKEKQVVLKDVTVELLDLWLTEHL